MEAPPQISKAEETQPFADRPMEFPVQEQEVSKAVTESITGKAKSDEDYWKRLEADEREDRSTRSTLDYIRGGLRNKENLFYPFCAVLWCGHVYGLHSQRKYEFLENSTFNAAEKLHFAKLKKRGRMGAFICTAAMVVSTLKFAKYHMWDTIPDIELDEDDC